MASDNQSDSIGTESTSLVEDSLNILFEDVTYRARQGCFGAHKEILNGICGTLSSGELSVIMGPSGAGKSSLMDILAGYTKPTSGTVYVNGLPRDEVKFRRRSCYILQDDAVQHQFTVKESIRFAAELKLGSHISKAQKRKRVDEIIISLGLYGARNTKAQALSGGQRKRLAIGLELVSDPPVIFLDEPTSGLDSSMTKQLVTLLHQLARQGRTVVATMHQPSSNVLRMVDRLYAMVNGRCAYMGSVPKLIPYLNGLDLVCPKHHNPVDFLIEISIEKSDDLVYYSQNGRNKAWAEPVSQETDKILDISLHLTDLPPPKQNPTTKILLALKGTYATSKWKQFYILVQRSLLASWRDPSFTYITTGIHCAMALFVGCLFWKINDDAKHVRDNFNFMFFSLMFLMFTAFSSTTVHFPQQIPIVRREHFNRWYATSAYYLATLVAFLPTQTVCTLAFTSITYLMTGQLLEGLRFAAYSGVLLLVSYTALFMGLANGSMFTTKNGVVFGPLVIMPFTVFSGLFLTLKDAPFYTKWLFHVSFLKHGFVGLFLTVFGFNRPNYKLCTAEYCHYRVLSQLFKDNSMLEETYTFAVVALLGILTVITIIAYIGLKVRLKLKW